MFFFFVKLKKKDSSLILKRPFQCSSYLAKLSENVKYGLKEIPSECVHTKCRAVNQTSPTALPRLISQFRHVVNFFKVYTTENLTIWALRFGPFFCNLSKWSEFPMFTRLFIPVFPLSLQFYYIRFLYFLKIQGFLILTLFPLQS